jgi:hypothetical protein
MPKRRYLVLSESDQAELEHIVRRDDRPYMRERASALLQIADGQSAQWVSQHGLLRRRKPDTVIGWLNAYEQGGVAALVHKPRRKRDFPP